MPGVTCHHPLKNADAWRPLMANLDAPIKCQCLVSPAITHQRMLMPGVLLWQILMPPSDANAWCHLPSPTEECRCLASSYGKSFCPHQMPMPGVTCHHPPKNADAWHPLMVNLDAPIKCHCLVSPAITHQRMPMPGVLLWQILMPRSNANAWCHLPSPTKEC
jgi:hypothetical protein